MEKIDELRDALIDSMLKYVNMNHRRNMKFSSRNSELTTLLKDYKVLKSDKVEGYINVDVNEYLFLRDHYQAVRDNKTVYVSGDCNHYTNIPSWFGYEIHTSDEVIKELINKNNEIERDETEMYKRLHVIRKLSIWDFLKWKKICRSGFISWNFIDSKK
jgi:hypothetical protein